MSRIAKSPKRGGPPSTRAGTSTRLRACRSAATRTKRPRYEGAPLTWLLTLDGDLTEPTLPEADWRKASPEYRAAKAKGLITQELEEEYDMIDV